MEEIITHLQNYDPENPSEKDFKHKMLQLLTNKKEKAFLRSAIDAHFTASAWIVSSDYKKALLLYHAKLNKWLQPGGHADGQTDLAQVAAKEACEETGLINLTMPLQSIFDIDIHSIPAKGNIQKHLHYDIRYLYICQEEDAVEINHESKAFKWLTIEDILDTIENESLLRMARKTLEFRKNE